MERRIETARDKHLAVLQTRYQDALAGLEAIDLPAPPTWPEVTAAPDDAFDALMDGQQAAIMATRSLHYYIKSIGCWGEGTLVDTFLSGLVGGFATSLVKDIPLLDTFVKSDAFQRSTQQFKLDEVIGGLGRKLAEDAQNYQKELEHRDGEDPQSLFKTIINGVAADAFKDLEDAAYNDAASVRTKE